MMIGCNTTFQTVFFINLIPFFLCQYVPIIINNVLYCQHTLYILETTTTKYIVAVEHVLFKDGLSKLDWNIVQSLQKNCASRLEFANCRVTVVPSE